MEKFLVERSLNLTGRVRTSGAKNASLPILAAALLGTEDIILEDVPRLRDVTVMCEVLKALGAKVRTYEDGTILINSSGLNNYETKSELMNKMRASFLVMGPLLGRLGKSKNSLPGGCKIGPRPIDLHLKGFKALGARIEEHKSYDAEQNESYVMASADELIGDRIYLDFPSVGATENIMMAAVLAKGETVIENAAKEPEIVDLSNFLRKLGGNIKGAGTSRITINGVERLKGAKHQIIPDRIEAGTYMVAAAISGGDLVVENVIPNHLSPVIAKLEETGCELTINDEEIRVKSNKDLKAIDIKTLPYPGFPTDMQAQFMALTTALKGQSVVIETVFENRFMHVNEFRKMGADIKIDGRSAIINGNVPLIGTKVNATDLRSGAALILAGFSAEGKTEIGNIYHIERGYEDVEEKFRSIGGNIKRIEVDED
ncbi:MAG: UDP-N-acetylglucosamine 1-carboxyvinyltransferase [Tissierellia bacterium]|nr:UDP-N-acetylglucosamine 1-carboxyvinyltransferase [Tissierellia bacterium]